MSEVVEHSEGAKEARPEKAQQIFPEIMRPIKSTHRAVVDVVKSVWRIPRATVVQTGRGLKRVGKWLISKNWKSGGGTEHAGGH